MRVLESDILVLGSGGAGLFAVLHALEANPELHVTIAVKGLLGKSGCTRMVQGGYNVVLSPGDSIERHFMDTIEGGAWLNVQEHAWRLVSEAPVRIRELENKYGCFFDRNADGSVHQKAFAGQTFDRTVHKGDLTGIEIVSRLAEQVWAGSAVRLEEHRALALIPAEDGSGLAGVLMLDMRSGEYVLVRARATLMATGGGPTMYRYHTPSGDKSCDGMAMALRAGLSLRDMEMVQFHPTGLLAGPGTRMTGTVLEEGLRGAGGYLLDGEGRRFMFDFDRRGERATRDVVSRAVDEVIRSGKGSPLGGVFIEMKHLGPENVRRQFKGMVERCADCGFDLAGGRVEVVPTAHYMMGGVEFAADCATTLPGLFVAGEDTGGVHGANRLGGNGVANSTVFGGVAGKAMAAFVRRGSLLPDPDRTRITAAIDEAEKPFSAKAGGLEDIRTTLHSIMWDEVGIRRDGAGLNAAQDKLAQLAAKIEETGIAGGRAYNLTWHDWLNLRNLTLVSQAIAAAALARENSRGAHFRRDHAAPGDLATSHYTALRLSGDAIEVKQKPVEFTHVRPGETLVREAAE